MYAESCVDVHVHFPASGGEPDRGTVQVYRRLAKTYGVSRMVALGDVIRGGYQPGPDVVRALNDATKALVSYAPDLFAGMCYLNPSHGADFCLDEMERCVVQGGMIGVKLWVAVNARSPALDPIMQRAAELGLPVLHHAWYKTVGKVADESNPDDIAALAARHPKVPMIMAHLGGAGWRGLRSIRPYTNVFVDTSGASAESALVEYAVAVLGDQRVVFGSDMPGRDLAVQKARILGAKVSLDAQRNMLYGNAQRLFGFTGPGER